VIRFEWDESKNKANRRKHGVWFEEAQQAFDDPKALLFADPSHSRNEDRFILLEISGSARLLVVVHCEREAGTVLRVISARGATTHEVKRYEEGI